MFQETIINYYKQQVQSAEKQWQHFSKLVNTYSFLRLFVIAMAIFAIYQSVQSESVFLTEVCILLSMLAFAWLVSKQAVVDKEKEFYSRLKKVNENELDSICHNKNFYNDGADYQDDEHIYTSDLDIFGKGSLFHLLNRSATAAGNEKLAGWLKQRAATSEILQRQLALKELAEHKDWLQQYKARLLFAKDDKENEVAKLFLYLKEPEESFHPFLKKYLKVSPWLLLTFAFAGYLIPALIIPAALIGVINSIIVMANSVKINKADRFIGKASKTFYNYSETFKVVEQQHFKAEYLVSLSLIKNKIQGHAFHKKIKELSSLSNKLEYRLNIFVGPVLNFLFAWDVKQLIAIDRWTEENTTTVEQAFDDLSTIEALASLCSLHTNYPNWSFPEIAEESAYTYTAVNLGHPLIPVDKRVFNDFTLENDFKVDIITGSNMAGKSTFLRTLGINAVLALAGAPVCAQKLKVSNMLIFTYMRIKDSLNEGTSTFKAELNRLKLLLKTLQTNEKVYFMIDEMLRGTNSVDKYLGSKAIIEQLISQRAVGIVATHDLQIARLEEKYPDYVRNFYFDIHIINNEMLFDYKIKKGECKTFNAAILLKQLGIRFETEEI